MTPPPRRGTAGLLLAVCLLAGCTSEEPPQPPTPSVAPAPEPPTDHAPATESSYGEVTPQAPSLAVTAAVDLTPVAEGTSAFATAVAPGPDGGAYVLVTAPDTDEPYRLATIGPVDRGLGVVNTVPVPGMRLTWGLHPLPDGTVAVAGWLAPAERGFGFTVLDPATGTVRVIEAIPYEEGTASAYGHSAISPDGSVLYLFVGTTVTYRSTDLLVAVDAATGEFRAGRDLLEETRGRSSRPVGRFAAGLVPRPGGGVVLAFAGVPPGARDTPVPTLLVYDADLAPLGYRLPGGAGAVGETLAVTTGGRGTVFVAVSGGGEEWILAAGGDGNGPTSRALELVRRSVNFSFAVDPSESWVLLPAVDGVRAVDLASGQARTVGLGCGMGFPARALVPGTGGTGGTVALAIGECAVGPDRVPTLWTFAS